MRQGKALIQATKPYAKEFRSKSWWYTISTLILIVFTHVLIFVIDFWGIQLAVSVVAGLLLVRFFVISHDFQHHSILQRSEIAFVLFTVFGFYMLIPSSIWKRSHDHHHDHNSKLYGSSIGSFPIVTKEKFRALSTSERRVYLFIRHPFSILFAYFFAFLYGTCLRSFFSSPRRHWDSLLALAFHYSLGAFLVYRFGWSAAFIGFFLPIMIAHALGSYLFYAQHNFPGVTFEDRQGWTYINAALNSSSFMKMSPVMHWFTANIGYHHIHHLNSRIPFYRLPEAYADLPEVQNAKETSLHPTDVIRCFRLKVWDPDIREMISMRELNSEPNFP